MPTNEERREVAQRMFETMMKGFDFSSYNIADNIGIDYPSDLDGCFDDEREEAWKRLIDLIEPENVPEYAEWPKYEDGTPLRLGDELDFGDTCYKRARKVSFTENGVFISNQGGSAERVISLRKGERLSKKIE